MKKLFLSLLIGVSSVSFSQSYSLGSGICENVQQLAVGDRPFYCTKDKIKLGKTNNIEFEIFISKYLDNDEVSFSIDLFKWVDDNIVDIDVDQNFEITFTDGKVLSLRSDEKSGLGVELNFSAAAGNMSQFESLRTKSIQKVKVTVNGSPVEKYVDADVQQAIRDNINCMLGLSPIKGSSSGASSYSSQSSSGSNYSAQSSNSNYVMGEGDCNNVQVLTYDNGDKFYCPKTNIKINSDQDIDIEVFIAKHPDSTNTEFAFHVFYDGDSKLISEAKPEIKLTDGTDIKFSWYVASQGGVIMRTDFRPSYNNMYQLDEIKNGHLASVSFNSSEGRVTKYVSADAAKNIHNTLNCILGLCGNSGTTISSNSSTSGDDDLFGTSGSTSSTAKQPDVSGPTQFTAPEFKEIFKKIVNDFPNNYKNVRGKREGEPSDETEIYPLTVFLPGMDTTGESTNIVVVDHLYKNKLKIADDWSYSESMFHSPDKNTTWKEYMNLIAAVNNMAFSFGKLKMNAGGDNDPDEYKSLYKTSFVPVSATDPRFSHLQISVTMTHQGDIYQLTLSFENSKTLKMSQAENTTANTESSSAVSDYKSTSSSSASSDESSSGDASNPDKEYTSAKALGRDMDYLKAVCMDEKGNLLILADYYIYRYEPATGKSVAIAGNLEASTEIDDIPANKAELINVKSIVTDKQGNIYFSEDVHPVVRKIDKATGKISVYAGNRTEGFSGDGGPATNAQLWVPGQLAVDAAGNLYIADMRNNRIRKVDAATGIITTVAGSQSDDDKTFGSGFDGNGGQATAAKLSHPVGVAVDATGNIFISDEKNNRVRKVDGKTGIISTYAGTGEDGFSGDGGLAVNAKLTPGNLSISKAGNLYIGIIMGSDLLCKVNKTTGIITIVGGHVNDTALGHKGDGGPALKASVDPASFAIDAQGNIYMAGELDKAIREIDAQGIIKRVAGIYEDWSNNGSSQDDGDY